MNLIETDLIKCNYVKNEKDLKETLDLLKNTKEKIIGLDTETAPILEIENSSALDRHTSKVEMIQLMTLEWDFPILIDVSILGFEKTKPIVEYINSNYLVIAFNAKFDIQQIMSSYNIFLKNTHCVQVALWLLSGATGFKAAKIRKFNYKAFCRDLFKIHLDKSEGTSNWASLTKTESQLQYAALDVGAIKNTNHKSYLIEGYYILKDLIINQYDMKDIFELEQKTMAAISKVEYIGMPINKTVLDKLLINTNNEIENLKVSIAEEFKLEIRQKVTQIKPGIFKRIKFVSKDVTKSLNSPIQLKKMINDYFKNLDTEDLLEIEDTSAETFSSLLNLLEDNTKKKELISNIILYKNLSKLVDKNWDKLINPISGCIHPNFNTIGASTGRMSSSSGTEDASKFNAQSLAKRNVVVEITEEEFCNCNAKIL